MLSLYHVKRASELDIANNQLLLYFLAYVVDTKVLSLHVQRFSTLNDAIEERIKICELLYEKTEKLSLRMRLQIFIESNLYVA